MRKSPKRCEPTAGRMRIPCEDSISAVEARGVNCLWPFEPTASVGPGPLERGDRAVGSSRNHTTQCEAFVGVGPTGTSGVSALARVVSGCEAQKRKKAAGIGRDLVLCALVAVDRASLGKREPTNGAGLGCNNIRRALDDFIHQRGGVQVCDPGSVEGLGRA